MISPKNLVLEIHQTIRQDGSLQVAGGKAQLTVLEDTPLLTTGSADSVMSFREFGWMNYSRSLGRIYPCWFASPAGRIGGQLAASHARQLAGRLEILAVISVPSLATDLGAQDFAFSSLSGQVNDATGAASPTLKQVCRAVERSFAHGQNVSPALICPDRWRANGRTIGKLDGSGKGRMMELSRQENKFLERSISALKGDSPGLY